jgi:mannose/fructose-specific phosphotransferase system component IIA
MNPPYPTLLVTHRGYGEGLLAAAEAILGARPAIDHMSNEGLSPDALLGAIEAWLDTHASPAIVLTDLVFGSCAQSSRIATRNRPDTVVVSGVSLPMILALLRSREHGDLREMLRHLRQRTQESVCVFVGSEPLEGNPS